MMDAVKGKNKKYLILTLLFLGWCLSYLDRMSMNVSIVQIAKEFHLSPTGLGVVLSSFFAGYALMQIPGGWLADKYGSRKVVAVCIIFWSIFTVATGVAGSLMSMIFIRFLFGLGEGGYPAASSKAIADSFSKAERSSAQTIMMSSNSLGGVIAPLIATPLLVWVGWRNIFFTIGIFGAIVAWLLWHNLKPENMQAEKEEKENLVKVPFKKLIKDTTLWKLAVMWFGMSTLIWGLISWMPLYLTQVRGLNLMTMGMLTSVPALTGAIGTIVGGRLFQKYFSGREKYYAIVFSLLALLFLYLLFNAPSVPLVITYQALCTTFHGLVFAIIMAMPHQVFSKNVIGSSIGFINFGGQIGALLAPTVMGFLLEKSHGSYQTAFMYVIICGVLTILAAATLSRSSKEGLEVPIEKSI
jgi:sugar phosphate permease